MTEHDKHALDLGVLGALFISAGGVLPGAVNLAVSLGLLFWIGIRIYETDTVQKWLGKK